MANTNDQDRSSMLSNNNQFSELLQEAAFSMGDDELSDFKNEISLELIKLVRTHLNHAQIKGIISTEIRDYLLTRYVADLKQMEQGIKQRKLLKRLQELETMQEQLVQVYHESLDDLHTEIQEFRSDTTMNESITQSDEHLTSPAPTVVLEPKPTQVKPQIARPATKSRFRKIQTQYASFRKYLLSATIISAFTIIGIHFGMTIFMATGALVIGGTLLTRFAK